VNSGTRYDKPVSDSDDRVGPALPPLIVDKIIDYCELIARSTYGFVIRQWLRDTVDVFLPAPGPRAFLLLGE